MEKKSLFVFILITVFTLVFLTPRAQAGPEERYRWEGIAIGVGAAIVGGAILHNYYQSQQDRYTRYEPARDYRPDYRRHAVRGHWEVRKEWVPPAYKRVWNPGHYNRYGQWVPGQWLQIYERPGYWVEKKVWVRYR